VTRFLWLPEKYPLTTSTNDRLTMLLCFVDEGSVSARLDALAMTDRVWIEAQGFNAERGRVLMLPAVAAAYPNRVWIGLGSGRIDLAFAQALPDRLYAGDYRLESSLTAEQISTVVLGFALGSYRYGRYKTVTPCAARLVLPEGHEQSQMSAHVARADRLARDLINTPAQDLGPRELGEAVVAVAERHGAIAQEIVGDSLLEAGFPAVHAVGRSAAQPPRLLTLRAGSQGPLVALVGKGVCFDTGGLDLKPAAGMALMKKDMGGAAIALAVADLVLAMRLPVRLLLVIPAVENGVGPNAFRPGDVLSTRKGLTVEVTNTDAEGRLVLADALTFAAESQPDLIIDFATLTGAARVALGPELPAAYASHDSLQDALSAAARTVADPLWPMPLWSGYEDELQSKIADLQNASSSGFAGSITAALFLRRFVPMEQAWLHLDLYAWNPKDRPGRPVGAEAQTLRAVFELLRTRYCTP
jgi:leucyl aminopeptidase